jgi:N-acetylmuramoyl-L-alanine amidase
MVSARLALRALLLALVTLVALAGSSSVGSAEVPLLICIDPGHGGTEPGAVNGSLIEKDINLDVSMAVAAKLEAAGHTVEMTRSDDSTHSIRERYTFCNDIGADLLLSIHTNALADPDRDGIITIYFHNDDKVLAQALHDELLPAMSDTPHFFQDFGVKRDALGMVLKSNMPAAVIEPVMMSNLWEAARLARTIAECSNPSSFECRRAQIAEAIYQGTTAYIGALPSGGGGGGGGGPTDFCEARPEHRRCQ